MSEPQKPHYKLPASMRHKTLDLRASAVLPSTNAKSKPLPQPVSQPNKDTSKFVPERKQKRGHRKLTSALLTIFALILVFSAAYILWLMFAPKIQKASSQKVQSALDEIKKQDKNTLFIPSAGVYSPVLEGGVEQLDKGLWHRMPENGNPKAGGNFVVSGHSFVWGYTPQQIKEKSFFYNLEDVKVGDEIITYWDKKVYYYKITEKKTVKPNDVQIEDKTQDPTLTVYTCTPGGSTDGRVVVIAKPK